jgi:[acyl-carrier-protein] S-malonyltransferase
MQKILAMFPGQGSQYVGMGAKLLAEFPATRAVFEEAEDACQLHIRRLCQEGPDSELKLTANTQPCLLTVSVAYWKALHDETGLIPSLFAGHSLGEYSALVAAGKLSLGRAAYLVRKRGEAMQEAVPAGVGAMAAVLKMPMEQLEALCLKHTRPNSRVEIANYNSDAQLVIAGHTTAVLSLCEELQSLGVRYVELPVSAPFHSSLMAPAREAMAPLLQSSSFEANTAGIIANLTGQVVRDYEARYLIEQIDSPVRWIQSIETAKAEGMTRFIEIGPGKVLFGMVRRMVPRDGYEVLATEDLKEVLPSLV